MVSEISFYRKPSADMLYDPSHIEDIEVTDQDILHFCSVDLVESLMKQAHSKMIEKFEKANGTIVFDPNVRLPLWKTQKHVVKQFMNLFLKRM